MGRVIGVYIADPGLVDRLERQAIRLGFVRDGRPQPGPLCAKMVASAIDDIEAITDEEAEQIVARRERGELDAAEVHGQPEGEPVLADEAGSEAEGAEGSPGGPECPPTEDVGENEADQTSQPEESPEPGPEAGQAETAEKETDDSELEAEVVLSGPSVPRSRKPASGRRGRKGKK